ncbi:MAG: FHA domain-containing protein [Archangium sp.]|nr:FHA domain-containing protein [Archangium sp.]
MAPLRQDGVTRVGSIRTLLRTSPRQAFCDKQRMMASAVIEERRPGLFVFAAHLQYGHVARLWLEASAQPRAGTIGRHQAVDLALPLDDALSLRHLLFVVRKAGQGVQFQAIDLETCNGMQLESGQAVRLVEASGPLILCASDFLFFCFPTGQPLPWDRDCLDPWGSLRPRLVTRQVGSDFECTEPMAGWVTTQTKRGEGVVSFGNSALRAGVLIGRAERCDVVVPVNSVSRVHAVLILLDDGLWVLDAGSTNGTWRLDEELKIARVGEGDRLGLGSEVFLGWRGAH